MSNELVATPYARALLGIAVDEGSLRNTREQFANVMKLVRDSEDLARVFSSATISGEERNRVVDVLATRLALSRTLRNFLFVLSDRRRLGVLADIERVFQRLSDAHLGVIRAEAVSSVRLSVAQTTRLKNTLAQITGKTVVVSNTVDPQLIGGVQVKVGGKLFDASVRTQLRQLRSAILSDL